MSVSRAVTVLLGLLVLPAEVAGLQEGQGQAPVQDSIAADSAASSSVPLVFRGDTLFRLQQPLGPFDAQQRAEAVLVRLRRITRNPLVSVDSVSVLDGPLMTSIVVEDRILLSITDDDARAMGMTRPEAAELIRRQIAEALSAERSSANLRALLTGVGLALLVTLALALILWGFHKVFPKAYRLIRFWKGKRIPSLRVQKLEILSADRIVQGLVLGLRVLRVALTVAVLYFYLPLVFSFFPATRDLSGDLIELILDPLAVSWAALTDYLPNLFFIAIFVALTYYGLRLLHLVFKAIDAGMVSMPGFYPDWAIPTYKIIRVLVLAFAVIIIWPYLPRSDSAAFRGVAAFLGLLVTFGSASAVANLVGGVVMIYMRPFQVGDRVRISDTVGDVVEKSLLVTRIRTIKNVEITIPNAMVLGSHIVNYTSRSSSEGLILNTGVTIGYDVPWRDVHEALLGAAREVDGVLAEPEPFVLQTGLNDFYVSYELNVYTDRPHGMAWTYSQLHQNIQDRFDEAGIEILSPHYSALRDGNATTVAGEQLPPDYEAPSFRVKMEPPREGS